MYNLQLDSKTILQRLKESKAYGTLQAEIAPGTMLEKFSVKGAGKVKITLQFGEVVACEFYTSAGVWNQQDEILSALARIGVLEWSLLFSTGTGNVQIKPTSSATTGPIRISGIAHPAASSPVHRGVYKSNTPPPQHAISEKLRSPLTLIPYRINSIPLHLFNNPVDRKVYQLIDGQRTIGRIATLVHIPPQDVLAIMQSLQAEGIIGLNEA